MTDDIKGNTKGDTGYTERAYQTSEVAIMLDLAVPTVRKYAQSLESQGYMFIRAKGTGKHQARLFVEKDVSALRYLKEVREKGNTTVEQATSIVVEMFGKGTIRGVRGNDTPDIQLYNERYSELKDLIYKQNELIEELAQRVDQQQSYIKNRLNKHDELLTESLRQSMETRKLIAAAEEDPAQQKGFFSRLFKK